MILDPHSHGGQPKGVSFYICTIVFLLRIACSSQFLYANTSHNQKNDLMKNPKILLNDKFNVKNVFVEGIKLGDPEQKIPASEIVEKNKYGWRFLKSKSRFRVKKGVVVEMGIPAHKFKELGIHKEKDIKLLLGKPDYVKKISAGKIVGSRQYHYKQKGIIVHWIVILREPSHITVVMPSK